VSLVEESLSAVPKEARRAAIIRARTVWGVLLFAAPEGRGDIEVF